MKDYSEVVSSLEQSLEYLLDAKSDSRYIEGVEGIIVYEELDRLALLIRMSIDRVLAWERDFVRD